MKETTVILLCAMAVAQAGKITPDLYAQCECIEPHDPCKNNFDDVHDVLLPHKYCNMFYKCSNGEANAMKCASNLLYDPVKQICEWPHMVACGDRRTTTNSNDALGSNICDCSNTEGGPDNDDAIVKPPVDDKPGDSVGNNDTDGNEGIGNDNNDNKNNSTCNCNPADAPVICARPDSDSVLVANEKCNKFYICTHGKPVAVKCRSNTLYNPYKEKCDWPNNVECGDRVVSGPNDSVGDNDGSGNDSDSNEGNGNDNNDNDNNSTCNCNPADAPSICARPDSDSVLVANEKCNKFYICTHGKPAAVKCPPNTLYNPYKEKCDWPNNVECGDRLVPQPDDSVGGNDDNDSNSNEGNGNDNNDNDNNSTCNCNPADAPSICARPGSDSVLVANEKCNEFYICTHGKPVAVKCPSNTLYNPYKEKCDWPNNVECGDRVVPDPDDSVGDNDSNDSNSNEGNGNDNNDNDNNTTCNCNPADAPSICARPDSDSVLVANEKCNKFYICTHGKPVAVKCPPNSLYNPYKEKCDWPNNVECGDRVVPDPDDSVGDNDSNDSNSDEGNGNDNNDNENNSTCNCNPADAPAICARPDSDSVLVAHKKCNKFYICTHGKPVAVKCPSNTLYNPYKEKCDWPNNVECGDRVVPEPDDSVGDNDDNDSNSNEGNGNDNNDNDNNSTCNCNPADAPSICARPGSDRVLVANEKCNEFYICTHGKPVAVKCPPNTLYNPYKEKCDWAHNVDCGDRVVPDPDDSVGGNDGNGDDSDSNEDNENDNNDNDNNSTCNCNPAEAPSICASADSDGTLVAHEECNKFYKCAHSKPVEFQCPTSTFYNPYKEVCDWESGVVCDR